jgi:hypothetical protein
MNFFFFYILLELFELSFINSENLQYNNDIFIRNTMFSIRFALVFNLWGYINRQVYTNKVLPIYRRTENNIIFLLTCMKH